MARSSNGHRHMPTTITNQTRGPTIDAGQQSVTAPMDEDTASGLDMASPVVQLLGHRWTLAVFECLANGGRRYQDLHDALDGIAYKVLTETLRRAERDGLVARQLDPERVGTATLYMLTDLGRSLDVPLAAMSKWAEDNWQAVETARKRWSQLRS
jgi:DNA-binding HxlR family transcriptional regulator